MTANPIDALAPLRARKGQRRTPGLDDATVARFAAGHPDLVAAIDAAAAEFARIEADAADLLDLLSDTLRRASRRSFERHMLEQVRDAVLVVSFVARAHGYPDAE